MSVTVLIVDDSLTVRMDLVRAFEGAGVRTVACASAAEAREAWTREHVDVAVLDVMLPDGDGIELLGEIRSNAACSQTRVLMLSTEAEVADRVRGLQTGADDYVGKPYDADQVVARAQELIRGTRAPERVSDKSRVLVIDDSATFRAGLARALSAAGYEVLTAGSGEQGLRLAERHRPAALVIDGFLPDIDGSAVIRRVRLDAALRTTPCLLLTGSDEDAAELSALDAGADAFVRKHEDLDVILARLAAMLRRVAAVRVDTAGLLAPKRVLVVDDSPTYLERIGAEMRAEGYDVVSARSGEEALEILAVQPADCILLDLVMPGLGGKETCGRIKASPVCREIPLILVTSSDERDSMIEGLGAGADDFIQKSSEFEVLRARVRAQVRRKQFEDEHRRIREDLLRSELAASEARAQREVAETRAALADELQRKNAELEAFCYSVSHDLRAPLRSIEGFSRSALESHADHLDEEARSCLRRVVAAAARMSELIDDLLQLSRVSLAELRHGRVRFSELATAVVATLREKDPERVVDVVIEPDVHAHGDARLLRVLLENLLGNAWKFTSKTASARIECGVRSDGEGRVLYVRDNGAGFDPAFAAKLFLPFQRLHDESEFPGTGIGLATVRRIVERHGGRVWAESSPGRGATFLFSLPALSPAAQP